MTIALERPTTTTTTHTLHEVSGKGDASPVTWDPANADEVDAARVQFNQLRAHGYLGYAVDPADASSGEQLREFDPAAHQIVLCPPLQGG